MGLLFSHSVMSDSAMQWTAAQRLPCPSSSHWVCSNLYPLSRWCHPTISSSVIPFSYCLQSFPASGSFQMSQLFTWGGQSIGVSASISVLPMNIQDWFSLGWTGWISLQSKGLSRVFSNATVQKHQFKSSWGMNKGTTERRVLSMSRSREVGRMLCSRDRESSPAKAS